MTQEVYTTTEMEIYAFADLAAGEEAVNKRKILARQTVIIAARDPFSRWFVLYEWAGRTTASKFKDKILEAYETFRPYRFGLEANGMQVLFGALVRDEGKMRFGQNVPFVPIYQPKGVKKEYRIRTALEPIVSGGRLFLLDKTSDLAQEIRGFPTAKTKDLVDSLATIISMAPKATRKARFENELREYASYLRSTGCPTHTIQQKVIEHQRQLEIQNN